MQDHFWNKSRVILMYRRYFNQPSKSSQRKADWTDTCGTADIGLQFFNCFEIRFENSKLQRLKKKH